MVIDLNKITIGTKIPELRIEPISRTILALYAGASGDHNPIHIDIDFAKNVGLKDVFAHGMLVMSYLGRAITDTILQSRLKDFKVRFCSITNIGDILTCGGEVIEIKERNNIKVVILELHVIDQDGDVKLTGIASFEK
tara:strand:+ start:11 stop:424 length:414 start_codon:yes stop_codon:yes gene_type:complete